MNKITKVSVVAAVLFVPRVANAAPPDAIYQGAVEVYKGITLSCRISFELYNGATRLRNLLLPPGDLLCSLVKFNNQPYIASFTGVGSGTYTIYNVDVSTITPGDCLGNATGTWSGSTIYINTTLPPKTPGTGNCTAVGTAGA